MALTYILHNHTPIPEPDLGRWAQYMANADRTVAKTRAHGGVVSTVFLGADHNFTGDAAPVLFETMIFGGPYDQYMQRRRTWEEAEAGHQAICGAAWSPSED